MALVTFNQIGARNAEVMLNTNHIVAVEPGLRESQTIIYVAVPGLNGGPHSFTVSLRYGDVINRLINEVPEFRP